MADLNQNDEIQEPIYKQNEEARAWPFVYRFAKEKGVEWEPGSDIGTRGLLDLIWKASESVSRAKLESAEAEVARLREAIQEGLDCGFGLQSSVDKLRASLASPAQKDGE